MSGRIYSFAMRIVSLLPSATEIVCALGLESQLVGVTHECDFPASVSALPKVTKTLIPVTASSGEIDRLVRDRLKNEQALYTLDQEVFQSLRPDLVVTQSLCDVCAVAESEVQTAIAALAKRPRVVNLEPTTLEEVFAGLLLLGEAAEKADAAAQVVDGLRRRLASVAERSFSVAARPSVLLLEWIDPPFSSGHWNPELVALAGGDEVLAQAGERSRTLAWDEVLAADPEVLAIACCGFSVERTWADLPILRGYLGWSRLRCVQEGRVYVVDGAAYFSRPGPRLVDSLELLAHTLHPAVHPTPMNGALALRVPPEMLSGALPAA